jgi:ornithine carbamoyltransferase
MHYLTTGDIDTRTLVSIVDRALEIKADPGRFADALKGRSMYMLFEKTSTRTFLSFSLGMNEMGGRYVVQNWLDSNFAVGAIEDETRYVSRSVDVIMARLQSNENISMMALYSTVPVINGCCDKHHPCQATADLMTIKELFGTFGVKMLYIGIHNNVFNSLLCSLPRLGGELVSILPVVNESSLDTQLLDDAVATGRYRNIDCNGLSRDSLRSLIEHVDIVYTDTWVDMEFFSDPRFQEQKADRIRRMSPFQLSADLLGGSKCIVMHDMPMHPGFEITREVIEAHIDTILLQAENRKHAQKAILLTVLG